MHSPGVVILCVVEKEVTVTCLDRHVLSEYKQHNAVLNKNRFV